MRVNADVMPYTAVNKVALFKYTRHRVKKRMLTCYTENVMNYIPYAPTDIQH